jgi:hypothetical protein
MRYPQPNLLIFETECRGPEHESFNVAFIESLQLAQPGATIQVYARPSHWQHLAPRIAQRGLHAVVEPMDLGDDAKPIGLLVLLRKVLAKVLRLRHKSKKTRQLDAIIFLSCNLRSFLAIKLIALLMPSTPMLVVFHGILEKLASSDRQWRPADQLFRRIFDAKPPRNLHYGLLGSSIAQHVFETGFAPADRCVILDHPTIFPTCAKPLKMQKPVVFGHLGYAHADKGFLTFLSLAEAFQCDKSLHGTAAFIVVGGTDDKDKRVNASQHVRYARKSWPTPRPEYEAMLDSLTYSVFTYPGDTYRFRASGAAFDAMAFLTPIIALRNPYFEYLFDLAGDIGYLCDSPQELIERCRSVARHFPRDTYAKQVANLKSAQMHFEPPMIADQLKSQFFGRSTQGHSK